MKLLYYAIVCIPFFACKKSGEPEPLSRISLISPGNNANVSSTGDITFSWTSSIPGGAGDVAYKIKIVEVEVDQSPDQAMRGNKPHFEKDSLKAISFIYPNTSVRFSIDSKYAWRVSTSKSTTTVLADSSAVSTFVVKG